MDMTPTVITEHIFMTKITNKRKKGEVATLDIVNTRLQADNDETINTLLR